MAEKTKEETLTVDTFSGVNEVMDEFDLEDTQTPWLAGGFVTEKRNVERLPGKLLNSSISSGSGSILALKQLTFTNRDLVLTHEGTVYKTHDDMDNLVSDPTISPNAPIEPFIF